MFTDRLVCTLLVVALIVALSLWLADPILRGAAEVSAPFQHLAR